MFAGLLLAVLVSGGQALAATPAIERVWTFNGGEVAIQAKADGTFAGTVVAATKFAECSHPVGELMWSGIVAERDGSYSGFHQWLLEGPACAPNPTLGPTAWRVMETKGGGHYLLVCFSAPGQAQPEIAASGTTTNVTYGCFKSAEVAPVPKGAPPTSRAGVQSFARAVSLPKAGKCFSRRVFQIHLHEPHHDPLKEVVVMIRGRRVALVRRGKTLAATINLKGLPRGTFTVTIHATTVLGHRLSGSRTYHTCIRRRTGGVQRAGHHHQQAARAHR